jgi:hypothetical protein
MARSAAVDATLLGRELIGYGLDGSERSYRVRLYVGGGGFGDVYKATSGELLVAL